MSDPQLEILTFEGTPPNIEPLIQRIEKAIRTDPNYAELVVRWLADAGIAASRDPAEDARVFAVLMAQEPKNDPEKALTAMGELVGIIALTGIGVVGIFDPTPAADAAGTVVALGMMRYSGWYFVDAALSGISMLPYLGDAVGKPVLLSRLSARMLEILRTLERFSSSAGHNVKVAIEAIKRGENIPRLPRGAVAVLTKAASSGSKHLDEVLATLRRMPDVPYAKMDRLKAYMAKRGIGVYDGAKGAEALDKMGYPNALGMFVVMKGNDGRTLTGFVFRGSPNRSVVHHELWHHNDFVRNYGGNLERWRDGTRSLDKERYVHQRMTGTGAENPARGQTRWNEYSPKERANQSLYINEVEQAAKLAEVREMLVGLGIKFD